MGIQRPKKDALAEDVTLDDAMSAATDLKTRLQEALDALENASSCETEEDCITNLREAQTVASEVVESITELLS